MSEEAKPLEAAAKAAFVKAQSVYRSNHDHVPLSRTWETTSEAIRNGWRKIAAAALMGVEEDAIAKVLAPYFQDGFSARDGANAVVQFIRATAAGDTKPSQAEDF